MTDEIKGYFECPCGNDTFKLVRYGFKNVGFECTECGEHTIDWKTFDNLEDGERLGLASSNLYKFMEDHDTEKRVLDRIGLAWELVYSVFDYIARDNQWTDDEEILGDNTVEITGKLEGTILTLLNDNSSNGLRYNELISVINQFYDFSELPEMDTLKEWSDERDDVIYFPEGDDEYARFFPKEDN